MKKPRNALSIPSEKTVFSRLRRTVITWLLALLALRIFSDAILGSGFNIVGVIQPVLFLLLLYSLTLLLSASLILLVRLFRLCWKRTIPLLLAFLLLFLPWTQWYESARCIILRPVIQRTACQVVVDEARFHSSFRNEILGKYNSSLQYVEMFITRFGLSDVDFSEELDPQGLPKYATVKFYTYDPTFRDIESSVETVRSEKHARGYLCTVPLSAVRDRAWDQVQVERFGPDTSRSLFEDMLFRRFFDG